MKPAALMPPPHSPHSRVLSYSWRAAVLLSAVILLSAWNLTSAAWNLHVYHSDISAAHGGQLAVTSSSLFAASALDGWRRANMRHGQSDADWARRILRLLWCEPSERAARGAWEAALVELAATLVNSSLLDRGLAAVGCRHACGDARLRSASADSGQPACAGGLCTCEGGRSIGFDMAVARDEPSAAFFAAQVAWPTGRADRPPGAESQAPHEETARDIALELVYRHRRASR